MNKESEPKDRSLDRLFDWLQRVLDWCFYKRKAATQFIVYASMRIYGLELSRDDVGRGAYKATPPDSLKANENEDLSLALTTVRDCYDTANDRRSSVIDKAKTLLTSSSLLLAIIGVLLPKQFGFESVGMRWLSFISVLALLDVVLLLMAFLDVGPEMEVALTQENLDADQVVFEEELINCYRMAQTFREGRTDYLVDLFKTARFFFLSAFVMVTLLFCINFLTASESNRTERLIRELRADAKLIELLRGPAGVAGPIGPQGIRGNAGSPGRRGPAGSDAIIDNDALVRILIASPNLKQLIRSEIEAINYSVNASEDDGEQPQ